MQTEALTPARLKESPLAVPPLARNADLSLNKEANDALIQHIERSGVNMLLYGGNAIFYHIALSEFESVLTYLAEAAGDDTLVIPSVGPSFGMMMDQAKILKGTDYPTVMVLPQKDITTADGIERGVRMFADAYGKPVVLYVKQEGTLEVPNVRRLFDDGLVSSIKYAIVREDTSKDEYLSRLVDEVDPNYIFSGIGEQPAIIHLRDFGLGGFTSGCICVAPGLSLKLMKTIQAGDWDAAEAIRETFEPLEDLRNEINPIRVLHEAVTLAGIGDMGDVLPLLSSISDADKTRVGQAAKALLEQNV